MGKQPYIPLYIGDWEQDTNCLSLEAEGAWLKLVFKCWKNSGVFMCSTESLAILFKSDVQKVGSILLQLEINNVCDIERREDGKLLIICRRLVREAEISKIRKAVGKTGGLKKVANQKKSASKTQPKVKQIPEYENEYDNEIEDQEKLKEYDDWTQQIIDGNDHHFQKMFMNESIPAGDHIQFWVMDHRDLLNRYPRMRPPNQHAFRKSCLKHIRENHKKPITNGTSINKKQQHTASARDYIANYYGGKPGAKEVWPDHKIGRVVCGWALG